MERALLFVCLVVFVFFIVTFAGYVKAWYEGELSTQIRQSEYEQFAQLQQPGAEESDVDIAKELEELKKKYVIYSEGADKPIGEMKPEELKKLRVALVTNLGTIIIKFYVDESQPQVRHFLGAVAGGQYNKRAFHAIWKEDVIFGGGPEEDLSKSFLKDGARRNPRSGDVGMLAIDSNRKPRSNTASRLFFICVKDKPEWDGHYSIFGKVEKGMDVVRNISNRRVLHDSHTPANRITITKAQVLKLPE